MNVPSIDELPTDGASTAAFSPLQIDGTAQFGGDGNESSNESAPDPAGGADGAETPEANETGVTGEVSGNVTDASPGTTTENTGNATTGNATAGGENATGPGAGTGPGDAASGGADMPSIGTGTGPNGPSGGGGGGLFNFDVGAQVTAIAEEITAQLQESFAAFLDVMITLIIGTPAPNRIIGAPTNEPWATAYAYYQGDVTNMAMILFVFAIAAVGLAGTVSGILSRYQSRQLIWRAVFGLFFFHFWWPAGALALNFEHWLTTSIAPSGDEFAGSMEGVIASIAGAAIAVALLHTVATSFVVAIGIVYAARYVALVGLMVFMVIFVMLWIVNVSVFNRISNMASGMMSAFVPLLFLTLPTAILFRVAMIFFTAAASGAGGFFPTPVLLFLALGTLAASVFAPKYTFDITQRFMAESFGAERIGNALDDQYAKRKEQVKEWYSGDDPTEPPEQTPNPPQPVPQAQLTPSVTSRPSSGSTPSPAGAGVGASMSGGPSPPHTSTATGTSQTPVGSPSPTATGDVSGNKYAAQDAQEHRLNTRRRQLSMEFNRGFQ